MVPVCLIATIANGDDFWPSPDVSAIWLWIVLGFMALILLGVELCLEPTGHPRQWFRKGLNDLKKVGLGLFATVPLWFLYCLMALRIFTFIFTFNAYENTPDLDPLFLWLVLSLVAFAMAMAVACFDNAGHPRQWVIRELEKRQRY